MQKETEITQDSILLKSVHINWFVMWNKESQFQVKSDVPYPLLPLMAFKYILRTPGSLLLRKYLEAAKQRKQQFPTLKTRDKTTPVKTTQTVLKKSWFCYEFQVVKA